MQYFVGTIVFAVLAFLTYWTLKNGALVYGVVCGVGAIGLMYGMLIGKKDS
jgi:hypothetical protein